MHDCVVDDPTYMSALSLYFFCSNPCVAHYDKDYNLNVFLIPLILQVYSDSFLGKPHFEHIFILTPVPYLFRTSDKIECDFKNQNHLLYFEGGLIVEKYLFFGVGDGERSRNLMLHRHALCRLSYAHQENIV